LIAYFIRNISAKNIKIHSRVSKLQQAKGGTFSETRCTTSRTKENKKVKFFRKFSKKCKTAAESSRSSPLTRIA